MSYQGVHNRIDILEFGGFLFENLGLDSGFRRRDEFEGSWLFVIPAKAGIQEEFDVYTIMALLVSGNRFWALELNLVDLFFIENLLLPGYDFGKGA